MDKDSKIIPTLDSPGWITVGVRDKLDRLMSNFFTTDGMQSTLYYRTFKTYQVISSEHLEDVEALRESVANYLENYLRLYFNELTVDVQLADTGGTPKDLSELNTAYVGLIIRVDVLDKEKMTYIEKPVYYKDGVFRYTMDKFNRGF